MFTADEKKFRETSLISCYDKELMNIKSDLIDQALENPGRLTDDNWNG
jgi:hypothetical protein